jgi:UDP-N-acetylglucosamine 1-carboxyvinyltransferase
VSRLYITGGRRLEGTIAASGNKNSALKLIPASLLGNSPTVLTNVPIIRDVYVQAKLVEKLGAKVKGFGTHKMVIDPSGIDSYELDPDLTGKIRASVVLVAPILAKFGRAIVTPPGGDQIGERLLDTHIKMMGRFGVKVEKKNGQLYFTWEEKKVGKIKDIFLEEASVTATEMAIMMAATSGEEVLLEGIACEPHVTDLAEMLNKMGTRIEGAGTNRIKMPC